LSLVIVLLVSAPVVSGQEASPPVTPETIDGRFDIGGRFLYLRCTGSGSPTVILEGFPFGTTDWAQVEAGVAGFMRVCVYEPAGYGLSDPPPPGKRTFRHLGEDLWAVLAAAGVLGPFVLVGAVSGGDTVLYYHRMHPTEVVGLVLVSPRGMSPDVHPRFTALLPPADQATDTAMYHGEDEFALDMATSRVEFAEMPPAPIVPAVVIRGGLIEDYPPAWPGEELEAILTASQEATAQALGARLVVAEGVRGNRIWTEQPETVIEAISDVVEAVRNPASWATPAP
jgi:pimeloyl-ACP methyl ester carboxylesterase